MVSDFVYIVTRIQDSNRQGHTIIPNLGVHKCPVTAIRHFESVVENREGSKKEIEYMTDMLPDDRYILMGVHFYRRFGMETEEIRLEKWKVK